MSALKTTPMKELTMDYVMARLRHGMSKCKETDLQDKDTAMVLQQSNNGNSFSSQGANEEAIKSLQK
jgi:hypothetical protein